MISLSQFQRNIEDHNKAVEGYLKREAMKGKRGSEQLGEAALEFPKRYDLPGPAEEIISTVALAGSQAVGTLESFADLLFGWLVPASVKEMERPSLTYISPYIIPEHAKYANLISSILAGITTALITNKYFWKPATHAAIGGIKTAVRGVKQAVTFELFKRFEDLPYGAGPLQAPALTEAEVFITLHPKLGKLLPIIPPKYVERQVAGMYPEAVVSAIKRAGVEALVTRDIIFRPTNIYVPEWMALRWQDTLRYLKGPRLLGMMGEKATAGMQRFGLPTMTAKQYTFLISDLGPADDILAIMSGAKAYKGFGLIGTEAGIKATKTASQAYRQLIFAVEPTEAVKLPPMVGAVTEPKELWGWYTPVKMTLKETMAISTRIETSAMRSLQRELEFLAYKYGTSVPEVTTKLPPYLEKLFVSEKLAGAYRAAGFWWGSPEPAKIYISPIFDELNKPLNIMYHEFGHHLTSSVVYGRDISEKFATNFEWYMYKPPSDIATFERTIMPLKIRAEATPEYLARVAYWDSQSIGRLISPTTLPSVGFTQQQWISFMRGFYGAHWPKELPIFPSVPPVPSGAVVQAGQVQQQVFKEVSDVPRYIGDVGVEIVQASGSVGKQMIELPVGMFKEIVTPPSLILSRMGDVAGMAGAVGAAAISRLEKEQTGQVMKQPSLTMFEPALKPFVRPKEILCPFAAPAGQPALATIVRQKIAQIQKQTQVQVQVSAQAMAGLGMHGIKLRFVPFGIEKPNPHAIEKNLTRGIEQLERRWPLGRIEKMLEGKVEFREPRIRMPSMDKKIKFREPKPLDVDKIFKKSFGRRRRR